MDFPKQCAEWYSAQGTKGTGIDSAGTNLTFDVPESTDATNE